MSIIVVWPSTVAVADRSVESLDTILSSGCARGFAASSGRINRECRHVVLTSAYDEDPQRHFIAEITSVTPNDRLKHITGKKPYPAADIYFKNPRLIKCESLDGVPAAHGKTRAAGKARGITWSAKNVRYFPEPLPPDVKAALDDYKRP